MVSKFKLFFLGKQRRKISCFWSGHNCLGYKNEEEVEDYCSYGDFFNSFCGHWRDGERKCIMKGLCEEKNRSFKVHGDTDRNADICEIAKKCDSSKKWTRISEEPDINAIDNRKHFR